nr:MAG TPA: hypothetical protein [Caudoviricetes sp.]
MVDKSCNQIYNPKGIIVCARASGRNSIVVRTMLLTIFRVTI